MADANRTWHNRIAVWLGAPLTLVGLTTVFLGHFDHLGLKAVAVPGLTAPPEPLEVRAVALAGATMLAGAKTGLMTLDADGAAAPVPFGPADEVRDILVLDDGALLLAGKQGLWRHDGRAPARKLHKGDCWSLAATPTGYAAACKTMLASSPDGARWTAQPARLADGHAAPRRPYTLDKLLLDIHTGKIVFGEGKWVWSDALGVACTALGITGLVIWLRAHTARLRARRRRAALAPAAV